MSESTTPLNNQAVPPEEEELFKEFQAYVRSIYLAASDGAIQSLNDATTELRSQVKKLDETVTQSRESYSEMFLPAVQRFEESASQTLATLATKQNEIAGSHWERTTELLKKQAQEHRHTLEQQNAHYESYIKARIRNMTLILVGVMVTLAVAVPCALSMAFRMK
jgi:hypothetical protein